MQKCSEANSCHDLLVLPLVPDKGQKMNSRLPCFRLPCALQRKQVEVCSTQCAMMYTFDSVNYA